MLMSRKAMSEGMNMMRLIINLLITAIVIIFMMVVILDNLSGEDDTIELKQKIAFKSMLISKSCLVLEDEIGTRAGRIDPDKINVPTLENCANYPNRGYKITLKDLSGTIVKEAEVTNHVFDPGIFQICDGFEAAYTCNTFTEVVSYKDGSNIKPGVLIMEVMNFHA